MFIKQATAGLVIALALFTACTAQAADDMAGRTEQFYSQADRLRHEALKENETCFSCHGKSDITTKWKTDRGRTLQLHVDEVDYRNSVHSGQNCRSCHVGDGPDAFADAPHKFKTKEHADCLSCHEDYFKDIADQTARSYHAKAIVEKGKPFPCASCHDAHTFRLPTRTEEIPGTIAQANDKCLRCHSDLRGYQALTDKKLLDQNMAHWFLPHKEKHFASVRCVDCHADAMGTAVHTVIKAKDIEVQCEYCHSKSSAMTTKLNTYRSEQRAYSMLNKGLFDDGELVAKNVQLIAAAKGKPDSVLGFMNRDLLDGSYIIGITQTPVLNKRFIQVLSAVLLLILVHSLLRIFGTKKAAVHGEQRVIFPLLVRVWHWLNSVLILVLIVTGLSMHFAGGIPFEAAQSSHTTLAVAVTGLWGLYVLYLLLSGQLMQYLPGKTFVADTCKQMRYYLFGIYKGEKNPGGHTPEQRMNPLQQTAYLSVLFLLFPALLVSGAALFIPDLIPAEIAGIDGKHFVSMVHTASAFIMVIFLAVHLYLCTTGETIFALVRSMVTGKTPGSKKQ